MSLIAPTINIRPLTTDDFADFVVLMNELTNGPPMIEGDEGYAQFVKIIEHEGSQIFGAEFEGKLVSSATLHLLPNMTYGGRPYGLVENVVTLKAYQRQGFGRLVMTTLRETALNANAYKIMLLTGQGREAKGFYESLGYSSDQKYGMILRRALV